MGDKARFLDGTERNSYAKNWGKKDFAILWSSMGLLDYKIALQVHKEYPDFPFSCILSVLSDSTTSGAILSDETATRHSKKAKTDPFKTGDFKIKDLGHSRSVLDAIMEYKSIPGPGGDVYKHYIFVAAMIPILRNPIFDNHEMVERAKKYPTLFYRCINSGEYVSMLEKLWNHNRKKNTIRLR